MEDVEKLLVWINEQQLAGDSVSEALIYEKARLLHADLSKKMPASEFKASRGWFDKFKKRTGIHSMVSDVKCSFIHFISHLYLFLIVFCM